MDETDPVLAGAYADYVSQCKAAGVKPISFYAYIEIIGF